MRADRPTVDLVRPAIAAYYARPGNEAGGSLHIVLDDGNLENWCLEWCQDYAKERGDLEGAAIASLMLRMTMTQRHKLYRRS